MSTHLQSRKPSVPSNNSPDKPLGRVQLYLIELKTVLVLLREVLIEVKELTVVGALILFFVWGAWQLFQKLH